MVVGESPHWVQQAHRLERIYEARAKQEASLKAMRPVEEIAMDPLKGSRQCPGDFKLRKIMQMLDQFTIHGSPLVRTPVQRIFHKWFIQSCLPKIYREDWEQSSQRILSQHGLKRLHSEVLCVTARRYGKTTSAAMFIAAMMICCPGIHIVVYSPTQRQSSFLQRHVVKFIHAVCPNMDRIVALNKENLFVASEDVAANLRQSYGQTRRHQDRDDVSELYTLPASVNGNIRRSITRSSHCIAGQGRGFGGLTFDISARHPGTQHDHAKHPQHKHGTGNGHFPTALGKLYRHRRDATGQVGTGSDEHGGSTAFVSFETTIRIGMTETWPVRPMANGVSARVTGIQRPRIVIQVTPLLLPFTFTELLLSR